MKTKLLFFSFLFIFLCCPAHELQIIETKGKTIHSVKKDIEQADFIECILPYDFSSMIFLLQEGNKLSEERYTYFRSVLKMYMNFVKQASFIDADHFLLVLKELSTLFSDQTPDINLGILKFQPHQYQNNLYNQLVSSFSTQYDFFKTAPQEFLQDVSKIITKDIKKTVEYNDFEQQYVRFLEIAYSKLLWNPLDIRESWSVVQETATLIQHQIDKKIIYDQNNIDDILWSLVTRYGYFVEMFSDDISVNILKKIKAEIDTTTSSLFAYDTKKNTHNKRDYLKRTFSTALVQKEVKVS